MLAVEAEEMRNASKTLARGPQTRSKWTVSELVQYGELNLPEYIKLNTQAYNMAMQAQANSRAYRVPQREVGYLSRAQIDTGHSIGTDNLQQCVAVIIDGHDRAGNRLIALAHVDKYTTEDSLHEVFGNFNKNAPLSIKLHGARDQGRQKAVSDSNFEMVDRVLDSAGVRQHIDQDRRRDASSHHNIIYTPESRSIVEGQYPNGGYQVASMVEGLRKLENILEHRDFHQQEAVARTVPLRVRHLSDDAQLVMSEHEAHRILGYYGTNGLSEQYKELETAWASVMEYPQNVPECCAKSIAPFTRAVIEAFRVVDRTRIVETAQIHNAEVMEDASKLHSTYVARSAQQSLQAHGVAQAEGNIRRSPALQQPAQGGAQQFL